MTVGGARRAILGLCLLLCAGQGIGAQDTVVVHADGRPAWGASPRLVEEVRIGTLEGDPDYALGDVGGIAVMPDGKIWVGDRHLSAIRRFDRDGGYVDQIGRKGEGPGEFAYPFGMRVLPDGSVVVWDDGQVRVSRFDTSGAFLDSFAPPTFMIHGPFEELEIDPEGNLYLVSSNFATDPRGPRATFWLKMRPDGELLDSVPLTPSEQEGTVDPIRTSTVLSPLGYVVTARNDAYALDLHARPESVVRIERDARAVAYRRAERAEKQRLEEAFSERNGRPERRIPRHKPPFSTFEVDSQGRIWVEVYGPGHVEPETDGERASRERSCAFFGASAQECDAGVREWRQALAYDVIEPGGRYLGRLTFPNRQSDVVFARGDQVWVVEKGALDEAYVVRYRIEPGG